jgi:dolichol-phosphate mannosyltransferase
MLSFFSGVQLLLLGAVGEYVGRIYEQGKERPLYLISEAHGIAEAGPEIREVDPQRVVLPPGSRA